MRDVVCHLLFHVPVLLGLGDIVDGDLKTVVRIYQHLYVIAASALGQLETEDGRKISLYGSAMVKKFIQRREHAAFPDVVDVRGRTVKKGIDNLYELVVGIKLFPFRGKYGNAAVIIMYVQEKPFLFKGNHIVALLQAAVAFQHLVADGTEL